jgi:lysophospholipase L1-like esterase
VRPRLLVLLVLVIAQAALSPSAASAQVSSGNLPNRMAAIGDSITRATNVCCWYGDHPRHSWTTGGARFDGIRSHYERIRSANPTIDGRNFNLAARGARMRHAPSQAATAVSRRAQYVTILMGANDACTSSPSTMTSVENFRAQFREAMTTLTDGLPRARVFVASIPNIYRLWEIYHGSALARTVWRTARICQSMLAAANTEGDRQLVLTRVRAFNGVLAEVCAEYSNCRFDGYAVFDFQFARRHVSTLDFFHPSLAGQANLASVTWAKSWWPEV